MMPPFSKSSVSRRAFSVRFSSSVPFSRKKISDAASKKARPLKKAKRRAERNSPRETKVVPACGGACKGGKKGKLLCEKVSRAEGFRQTAKTLLYLSYRLRVSFPAGDEKICDFFCFPFFPPDAAEPKGFPGAETTAKRRSGLSRRNRAERRIASAVAMELPPNFTTRKEEKADFAGITWVSGLFCFIIMILVFMERNSVRSRTDVG